MARSDQAFRETAPGAMGPAAQLGVQPPDGIAAAAGIGRCEDPFTASPKSTSEVAAEFGEVQPGSADRRQDCVNAAAVTQVRHARRADPLHLLRGSLSALTMLGIVGTAFELASLQHWNGAMQLVPWAALLLLAAALALHAAAGGRASQTGLVRALALLVLAASLFGVMEHALVNYDANAQTNSPLIGVLDDRFGEYRLQPTALVRSGGAGRCRSRGLRGCTPSGVLAP